MDLAWLFPWLLFLHILGAIVAFGFGFAAPLIGPMAAAEPQHGNFVARLNLRVNERLVRPAALSMAVTGVAMILVLGLDLTKNLWLDIAIVLYVIAVLFATFVQGRNGEHLVALTSTPPGPGGPNPGDPGDGGQAAPGWDGPLRADRGDRLPDGGEALPLMRLGRRCGLR